MLSKKRELLYRLYELDICGSELCSEEENKVYGALSARELPPDIFRAKFHRHFWGRRGQRFCRLTGVDLSDADRSALIELKQLEHLRIIRRNAVYVKWLLLLGLLLVGAIFFKMIGCY